MQSGGSTPPAPPAPPPPPQSPPPLRHWAQPPPPPSPSRCPRPWWRSQTHQVGANADVCICMSAHAPCPACMCVAVVPTAPLPSPLTHTTLHLSSPSSLPFPPLSHAHKNPRTAPTGTGAPLSSSAGRTAGGELGGFSLDVFASNASSASINLNVFSSVDVRILTDLCVRLLALLLLLCDGWIDGTNPLSLPLLTQINNATCKKPQGAGGGGGGPVLSWDGWVSKGSHIDLSWKAEVRSLSRVLFFKMAHSHKRP